MLDQLDDVARPCDASWVHAAVRRVVEEDDSTSETELCQLPVPDHWGVRVWVKDESSHPSGSLKHRLARSLVLYALVNGWVGATTTLVEASSGSTAVSVAYFARLLGLPFVAVLPAATSPEKVRLIERSGGRCVFVADGADITVEAARLARQCGGHFLDQFTYAERAVDWRGQNHVAHSLFAQAGEPAPAWVVVGAGTGGTSATIGRFIRYRGLPTKLCVVDPPGSAFFESWRDGDPGVQRTGSGIEGIGRPRVEPSFMPAVVDRMVRVPDAASVAAMHWITHSLGWSVGPSTGTNLIGVLKLATEMRDAGTPGSIVTLRCDRGDRYGSTYLSHDWLAQRGIDVDPWRRWIDELVGA